MDLSYAMGASGPRYQLIVVSLLRRSWLTGAKPIVKAWLM